MRVCDKRLKHCIYCGAEDATAFSGVNFAIKFDIFISTLLQTSFNDT